MASKKKRNKKYRGAEAKDTRNMVRIRKTSAVVRSDRAQWFVDHKKLIRAVVIGVVVVVLIVAIFTGFFSSMGTK